MACPTLRVLMLGKNSIDRIENLERLCVWMCWTCTATRSLLSVRPCCSLLFIWVVVWLLLLLLLLLLFLLLLLLLLLLFLVWLDIGVMVCSNNVRDIQRTCRTCMSCVF